MNEERGVRVARPRLTGGLLFLTAAVLAVAIIVSAVNCAGGLVQCWLLWGLLVFVAVLMWDSLMLLFWAPQFLSPRLSTPGRWTRSAYHTAWALATAVGVYGGLIASAYLYDARYRGILDARWPEMICGSVWAMLALTGMVRPWLFMLTEGPARYEQNESW